MVGCVHVHSNLNPDVPYFKNGLGKFFLEERGLYSQFCIAEEHVKYMPEYPCRTQPYQFLYS